MTTDTEISELDALSKEIESGTGDQKTQGESPEPPGTEQRKEALKLTDSPLYRDKGPEDLAKMHHELQKVMGRQSHEVGELRKLADELLKMQLEKKPLPDEEVDFFADPSKAVSKAIESNPRLAAAEMMAIQAHREMTKGRLLQKHPDTEKIVADPEFLEFVKSSKVKMALFQQAEAYDFDAADELLSSYKTLKKPDPSVEGSLKAASVSKGGSGGGSSKVYRRADLMDLRIRDPRKYEAMYAEIERAYAEGRVR